MSEGTDLVPHEDAEGSSNAYGYKEERKRALAILTSHTGVRQGEAAMIWQRIEYALDCACQEAAPDGPAMTRAMAVGIRAFITGWRD